MFFVPVHMAWVFPEYFLGVPPARWMVYFMENPIYKWMMTKGVSIIFGSFHMGLSENRVYSQL